MAELLNELEESMDDDIGQIKAEYMSKIIGEDVEEFNSSQVPIDSLSRKQVQELIDALPKPLSQKPFQPASSPLDEDNRFLCWNGVGIMRAMNKTEERSIDVMFHDAERHSYLNFRNDSFYSYGSLSDDVIVVGSNGKHGTGPATIMGINMLEPNRDKREWEIGIPHIELIDNLVAGTGFVAVATDQKFLRLFTNGGMQSYVLSIPGPALSMSAMDQKLMIVYHNGSGQPDDQNLCMVVYHVDIFLNDIRQTIKHVPVALSKRSPLSWIGFSDEGTPCTYDYHGIVRLYNDKLGWMPIINLKDKASSALDHFFMVGLCETSQLIRAVKCRRSRWPDFHTETAEVFEFSVPVCDPEIQKGKLEEEFLRLKLKEMSLDNCKHLQDYGSLPKSNEKFLVNATLKLFALYLKDDKEEMAKNLVFMMPIDHVAKLPEFAWKTNRKSYFIDSLNRAIEERQESKVKTVDGDVLTTN